MSDLTDLPVDELARLLTTADLRLVTAESCTGGLIAATLTGRAGSSTWFEGAFVTYRLSAKKRMLGVSAELLAREGAVSEPVARAMAEGALVASDAGISVAVTGLAGPDGGEPLLPVGTVWFAWALRAPHPRCVQTAVHALSGDRATIRNAAAAIAIRGAIALLEGSNGPAP
ncbi:MAG: CinA family protein [Pseudomonadales bacterium]